MNDDPNGDQSADPSKQPDPGEDGNTSEQPNQGEQLGQDQQTNQGQQVDTAKQSNQPAAQPAASGGEQPPNQPQNSPAPQVGVLPPNGPPPPTPSPAGAPSSVAGQPPDTGKQPDAIQQRINDTAKLFEQILQSTTIASNLVQSLTKWRDTIWEQFKIDKGSGQIDAATLKSLSDMEKETLFEVLSALHSALNAAVDSDGPSDPHSIMYKRYASNWAIIVLAAISILGLAGGLWLIVCNWTAATTATAEGTPSVKGLSLCCEDDSAKEFLVFPQVAALPAGGSVAFTTQPAMSGLKWTVSSDGSIDPSTGIYTAPLQITEQKDVHIVATYSDGKSVATATVTLSPHFVVSPQMETLMAGGSTTFKVQPSTAGITWTLNPSIGTITSSTGVYIAPASVTGPQDVQIVATSADGKTTAAASVTLVSQFDVLPRVATVPAGGSTTFTVRPAVPDLKWTIDPAVGSITTSTGTYVAPPTVAGPQDVHVIATTADGKTTATAIVSVVPPLGPPEKNVITMILLLGMMGGFLHMMGSAATFVGNRDFRRSWLLFYYTLPLEGAALALIFYLVLRVGVLSPSTSASGQGTADLNLFGLYAFATFCGLFSKQAHTMLLQVFEAIFAKFTAKDPQKPSPPALASASPNNPGGQGRTS